MELGVKDLKRLISNKKNICILFNDLALEETISNLNPKEVEGVSERSIYYWKRKERPIPVSCLIDICEKNNIERVNVSSLSINSGNTINLPENVDFRLYYFLGLLLGDGCLCISKERELKRQSYSVRIAVKGKERINHVSELMEHLFGIRPSCHKGKGCYDVCIYSKALLFFLNTYYEIPIGEKYDSIRVPAKIKNDSVYIKYFLRGLMDSDGNKYFHRGKLCFQLRQKSKKFLNQVYLLFRFVGLSVRPPYFDKANNSWVIWCSKKSVVDKFINDIGALKL